MRTPTGKFQGALKGFSAPELGAIAIKAAIEKAGINLEDVNEVIMGCVVQAGIGQAPARQAALKAGLPPTVSALTINMVCGSGLRAVALAAQAVMLGDAEFVVAGGMESISTTPLLRKRKPFTTGKSPDDYEDPWSPLSHPPTADAPALDMSITVAHNCAVQYGISRQDQDEWALRSHQRAVKAIDAGSFVDEIVPLHVPQADGSTVTFAEDEHPRRDTTLETLSGLKVLHPEIDGFTVTAGNSSGLNDAAAVLALAKPGTGKEVLANVLSWGSVGVPPNRTGSGPIWAIPKALELAGRKLTDVALFEINEAFAAQAVACSHELGLDEDIVNVYGSGISLGHPIAATGARMVTSAIYELRRRGGGIGVLSMCAGGGMGSAMVIEVA